MTRGTRAIAATEAARLLRQPSTWWLLALGEGLSAAWFLTLVIGYLDAETELRAVGVSVAVVARYFNGVVWSVLLIAPIMTMGCLADDRRTGMLRFLFSTPLGTNEIVLGKLLAVLGFMLAYVGLLALMPLTLLWGTPIDLGAYASGVLGLALFTLMHVALGVAASALTRVPVANALLALAVALALWSLGWAARLDPDGLALAGWSTLTRVGRLLQGLLAYADLVYFLAGSVLFAALAVLATDAYRRLA